MTITNSLPDGPRVLRFLRLVKFITQPIKYVEDFAKVYGDRFTIWGRKDVHIIYFSDPEALEQIFTADPKYFKSGEGNGPLRFLLGENSLILLDGDRHQRQRQLLTPPFHGDRMRAYGQDIRTITEQVSSQWLIDQPFNIRNSMQEITLNVILRVVFGLEEGKQFQELQHLLSSVLDFLGSPLLSGALFFSFLRKDLGAWSPWGKVLRLLAQIDEFIYALITERRNDTQENRQDILSLMMAARDADGQPMSDRELRDELMTLLVTGHETTASVLTWAFYWIDRLPEVQEKLLRELDTIDVNADPSSIAKLPYLTAFCQETLRLYPIVINASPRIVKSPIEIKGYTIPEKHVIMPSIYLAHHRPEVYPNPKQFQPERFLERQFSQYEYLPFGGGNRRCIGLAFAQYEMKIVLATILSKFQLSLVNKRPIEPVRRGFTIAPPSGMRMIAKPQVKLVSKPVAV
ncbi:MULTISPECIES: cytochrome P450 [Calothrix]|uniref:Cytochrome P450 n=2 Tax=Calothrix TaxID=1186 RepID=A0ABR8A5D5_9CYAN|nr:MULTISPECIES: cytochrome P450 [Calothrix]MBD2195059.1 cytochrome P450 [Calothrix parietina FACHB-288]MBD2223657.1 cytochrome P450 [Calothrix anomala FACHB-343]